MDKLNREYTIALRKFLIAEGIANVTEAARHNAVDFRKFSIGLRAIGKKLESSKLFEDIFKSMASVFSRIDNRVKGNIRKVYRKKKFPIPELGLKATSQELKNAAELNVALIKSIQEKQTEQLEAAVMSAVKGGSNFETVIEEVERQSTKGRAYAEMVGRDQVAKTYAAINQERSEKAGFPGYFWIATNDGKTRPGHADAELHDTFHLWSNPPLVKGENGQPDRNLHPGEDYNCRCIAEPGFAPD
jgi:SPP1 gp7 family putative phage head morphogenesis protein